MDWLRIFLFSGMLLHKLVWEVMKSSGPASRKPRPAFTLTPKTIVKLGKSAVLLFLLVQTLFLDILPITGSPGTLRMIGTAIYVLGLATAIIGRLQLGRNWANLEDAQVLSNQRLVQDGIYRFIRHPIYTGDLLLILGLELALNSWLVVLFFALAAVVVRQTLAEEAILARSFPEYQGYRSRSKMFIPFVV
jgi:protein-S-isoprenylcysteine O-methyltransferase Ste14